MKRRFQVLGLLLCGVLGLFAATFTVPATATGPTTIYDLPGLGYTMGLRGERVGNYVCNNYYVLYGNGAPETLIGDLEHLYCTTPAVIQQRVDALIAAYPPQAPTTTTAPATTAPSVPVSTATVTVTSPAVTTTVASPPLAPVTVTVPTTVTVTTTLVTPAPPVETATVTVTVTTDAPPVQPAPARTVTVYVRPKPKRKRPTRRATASSSSPSLRAASSPRASLSRRPA